MKITSLFLPPHEPRTPLCSSHLMRLMQVVPLLLAALTLCGAADKPTLTLAREYHDAADLSEYYASEKLDGVRAYWDGKQLRSRQGNVFAAPPWFVQGFPNTQLDGELWTRRGDFENISSIVRRADSHAGWHDIVYMIFDMPAASGDFRARLQLMQTIVADAQTPYLKRVKQWEIINAETLHSRLLSIVASGGEGVMLRHKSAPYRGGRSNDLLKLKLFTDAEAVVLSHRPGKGKFSGIMGSIKVQAADGTKFSIGSGFTHAQRENPPPLGATITFRHSGFTNRGKPRFAVFLRIRDDEPD